jgi:hypothetical protein
LITGAVDEAMNSKTLRHHNLQRANPLIKPLISGSLEEFHKPNFENHLRQTLHCPKRIKPDRWILIGSMPHENSCPHQRLEDKATNLVASFPVA